MISYNPVWAISEFGARMIEAGLPEMVARMDAARLKMDAPQLSTTVGDVAVIDVQGPLVKRESLWTYIGMATSTESVSAAIDAAAADEKVKSIVLNADSPGGTVDGMYKFTTAIERAAKAKPVIVQVDGMAASAMYWAASKATAIYAGPGDEVGSIGVRLMLYDFSRAFAAAGIEAIPIDTGEFKSAGAMGTKITDAQREDFQRQADNHFQAFYSDVKRGRSLSESKMKAVADGRIFIASEALDLGLIDGVQTMEQTLKSVRRLTGRSTGTAKARARWRELVAG